MITIADRIVRRIQNKGHGFAFTAKDFLDLGNRGSVDVALSSLAKAGQIRRVCRGVYDYPESGRLLGEKLAPDFDQVAHAIARNTGARIQPSGAVAANLLGLSDQVPAKIVYLTNGLSRSVRVGSQVISFKKTRPKELLPNEMSATVVQALLFLGKSAVNEKLIGKLRRMLTPAQRKRLLKDAKYTSDWVADTVRRIAGDKPRG
jgi:hypothetical protein